MPLGMAHTKSGMPPVCPTQIQWPLRMLVLHSLPLFVIMSWTVFCFRELSLWAIIFGPILLWPLQLQNSKLIPLNSLVKCKSYNSLLLKVQFFPAKYILESWNWPFTQFITAPFLNSTIITSPMFLLLHNDHQYSPVYLFLTPIRTTQPHLLHPLSLHSSCLPFFSPSPPSLHNTWVNTAMSLQNAYRWCCRISPHLFICAKGTLLLTISLFFCPACPKSMILYAYCIPPISTKKG